MSVKCVSIVTKLRIKFLNYSIKSPKLYYNILVQMEEYYKFLHYQVGESQTPL